jgi:molybdopterin converting factor subunit 1
LIPHQRRRTIEAVNRQAWILGIIMKVRLFARARDLAGADEVEVDLPAGATVADLRHRLAQRYPPLAALVEHCAFAVEDEFASDAQPLRPEAEVALLPPVSGG